MDNKFRTDFETSLRTCKSLTDAHIEHLLKEHDSNITSGNMSDDESVASILMKYFEKIPKQESKASTYRTALIESFTKDKTKFNYSSVGMIIQKFDQLVESGIDGKTAAKDLLKTYGYESFDSMMTSFGASLDVRISTPTSRLIEGELGKLPKYTKQSPANRIHDIVSRFNKNIHKCGATLNSSFTNGAVSILSDLELTALEQRVPQIESKNEMAYQSFASLKQRMLKGLEFEEC